MNKRKMVIGSTTAVLVGLLVSASALSGHPMGCDMDGHGRHARHLDRGGEFGMHRPSGMFRAVWQLDLSEEQQAQLRGLMEPMREASRQQMRSMKEARKTLREAMNAEPYDAAQVQQLAEAQGNAVTEMILKRAETSQQIRALLTPEQRAELDTLRSNKPCRDKSN